MKLRSSELLHNFRRVTPWNKKLTVCFPRQKKSLEHQYNTRLEFKPKEIAIEILKILNGQPLNREYKYFFWPTASLALSLEVAHSQAQREDLLDTLITYYKRWARKGGRLYYLDQIMNGYTLLYLFEISMANGG